MIIEYNVNGKCLFSINPGLEGVLHMKKTLSLLLVMMLLCMAIPTSVLAGGGLGLFVSGVEVTGTTADVLGDGTVAFDASTSTLTLKSANLVAGDSNHKAIVVTDSSSLTELTITLSSRNIISLNPNGGEADLGGIAINKEIDVKILGKGTLDITDKGTGKMVMNDSHPTAIFSVGNLTFGKEDSSAPTVNITCNRIQPLMAMGDLVINFGTINISVPTADGYSKVFDSNKLNNYGKITVSCDAYRPDLGTVLLAGSGTNEGTIELTASTGGAADDGISVVGLGNYIRDFTNNGTLKIKIGGDETIKARAVGISSGFSAFTNTGSCEIELSNIAGIEATGINAYTLDNSGAIEIRATDVGRNNDVNDLLIGLSVYGTVNNHFGGSIFIKIGDTIAPYVTGLEAIMRPDTTITNEGMINVEIGDTPNCQAIGILTKSDFKNLGSTSSVDISIGNDATEPSEQGAIGLCVAVEGQTQTLLNDGTINVGILEVMPGKAIVVSDQLVNTATGKISARAKDYGVYLDSASLDNKGVIRAYGYYDGIGLYVNMSDANDGLIYATGRQTAICTNTNYINGRGSTVWDDDTSNLGEIEYDSTAHQYYVKNTDSKIKTFYSVTDLMAYKQEKVKELEEALKAYVSEDARQEMEYWRDEILNATTEAAVDAALANGLQYMENAEDKYIQAKADTKQKLEELLNKFVSDEAKQIIQDAIDNLDIILNSRAFADLIHTVEAAAEYAEFLYNVITELEEAKNNATSDEAKAALDEAIRKVKEAETAEEVNEAKEAGLKDAEQADKALKEAQEAAIAELEELGKTTYTSDEAKAAMEEAIEAIQKATNLPAVEAALEAGKKAMECAGTLKDAQDAAINELEKAKKTAVSDEAKAALDEAIRKVKEATTVDEVTAAKEAGLKAAEEADKALKEAQDAAIAELEEAKKKAVSDDAKTALDEAIRKVKEATSQDAVAAAKKAAEEAGKALRDVIAAALAELDEAKVTASDEARTQIDAAKAKIASATSVKQVEELLDALYDAIFDIRYVLIEGNGLEWVKGSDVTAKFRSSAPYEKFVSVKIDNSTVPASEYTSENGSTIIWLKPSMLGKLRVGRYKVVVRSKDGLAKGYFYVKPALPRTGDNADPFLWTVLLTVSLGLAVTAIRMKRKEQ